MLRAVAALTYFALGTPGCTTREKDVVRPEPAAAPALSVADAQRWYIDQAGPPAAPAIAATDAGTALTTGPSPIDWVAAADTTAHGSALVLAPLRGLGQLWPRLKVWSKG